MSDDRIWVIEESTYIVRSNVPYVILFSRNYDDPTVTMRHEFKYTPYFYVPYGDAYNVTSSLIKQIDDTKYIDALGREVQRVYTHIPSDVPKAKLLFKWSDESDVLFDKRFLIDHHIKYAYKIVNDIPEPVELDAPLPPRRLYLDCEVIAPEGIIPLPQDAIYPIIMIQCRDSLTDKTVIFTTTIPETGDPTQFCCKNEQELLKTFALYVKELDPDVLVFWNGSKFDIPYIINRASILGISVSNLARNGQVKTSYDNGKFNNKIGGRSILDMLEAFKKFTSGMANRESYSLKNVIADKELLNKYDKDGNLITAYAFEYLDMGPMLQAAMDDKRYQELIDYGKNDVIALYNIDMSLGLYTFYENLKMISGAKLDDMLYNSRIIEMLIWHEGIKPMPEKQHFVDDSDKFQGAHVVEPKPGVHSMMGTYDLASLYPNILCAMQLSPDIDKIVLRTLEKTMAMREELRARCKADPSNEVLQNMQNAIKFLNNSYYGVMGLKSFRLYDRHIAETVTRTGRELNMFLQECAKSQGYEVVMGDTDSIGVISLSDIAAGKALETHLNNELEKWSRDHNCKVTFTLKFEKLYRRILFKSDIAGKGVKKKYCGHLIWEEGRDKDELNYKGLELKRSDQSNITRDVLHYFLETILIHDNQSSAVSYVRKKYKEVLSGNVDIYEISIPKALRKIRYDTKNPYISGILNAKNNYNYIITEGAKPRLIYLIGDETICIDEDFDTSKISGCIDWKKMAEVTIKKKMESYIWSIGLNWEAVVNGQNTLDAWF